MLIGKPQIERDRLYSIQETCDLLGMCRKTLRKYTQSGDLPMQVHPATGKMRYLGAKIEQFFNQTI